MEKYCENKFGSETVVEKCISILSVCLASPVPLLSKEIYRSVTFFSSKELFKWEDFILLLQVS